MDVLRPKEEALTRATWRSRRTDVPSVAPARPVTRRLSRPLVLLLGVIVALLAAPASAPAQSVHPPFGPIPPGTQITVPLGLDNWTESADTPADCNGQPGILHLGGVNGGPLVEFPGIDGPEAEGVYWNVLNPPSTITLPPVQLVPGVESDENVYVEAAVSEQCEWLPGHFVGARVGLIRFCCWSVIPGAALPAPPTAPTQTGGGLQPPGGTLGTKPKLALCNLARGIKPPNCSKSPIKERPIVDQIGQWTIEFIDDFLFDDIRKLQDPNVSAAEKALIIASYLIPVPGGPIISKTGRVVAKKLGPILLAALKKAERQIARACGVAARLASIEVRAASCRDGAKKAARQIEKSLDRKPIQNLLHEEILYKGEKKRKVWTEAGDTPLADAKADFRNLTRYGEYQKQHVEKGSPRVVVEKDGFTYTFRSKSGEKINGKRTGPPTISAKGPGINGTVKKKYVQAGASGR